MKWTTGLPLIALVLGGCSLFEFRQPILPDLPEPPSPHENRFAGYEVPEQDETRAVFEDPALDALRSPALSRFRSEEEFKDWMSAARAAAEDRGMGYVYPVATASAPSDMAMAVGEAPQMESAPSEIVVTGSSIPGAEENPEITNNQKAGVDEGGILKQIGQHLVILQDGRLFVTDLMPEGRAGLKLTDRADVYRSSDEDTWYDEVLVAGRTILVTGYSYREEATEYTVLNLGEDGKVSRQATFYISSNDYYSGSNYATRMIDGKLVIHTPIYLAGRGWWDELDIPVIREWRQEDGDGFRERTELEDGRPLFSATDIWMPVQQTLKPVIHTVTVCDISGVTDTAIPACKATAIVGTETHEFLVTRDAFWLWMSPADEERDREIEDQAEEFDCSAGPGRNFPRSRRLRLSACRLMARSRVSSVFAESPRTSSRWTWTRALSEPSSTGGTRTACPGTARTKLTSLSSIRLSARWAMFSKILPADAISTCPPRVPHPTKHASPKSTLSTAPATDGAAGHPMKAKPARLAAPSSSPWTPRQNRSRWNCRMMSSARNGQAPTWRSPVITTIPGSASHSSTCAQSPMSPEL